MSSRHRSLPILLHIPLVRRLTPSVSLESSSSSDSDSEEEEEKSAPNRLLQASHIDALDAIPTGGSGACGCCSSERGGQGRMLAGEDDRLEVTVRPEADLAGEGGCFRVCDDPCCPRSMKRDEEAWWRGRCRRARTDEDSPLILVLLFISRSDSESNSDPEEDDNDDDDELEVMEYLREVKAEDLRELEAQEEGEPLTVASVVRREAHDDEARKSSEREATGATVAAATVVDARSFKEECTLVRGTGKDESGCGGIALSAVLVGVSPIPRGGEERGEGCSRDLEEVTGE